MESYSWPGNIRELQAAVRRAMLMATGPTIIPELLPKEIVENLSQAAAARRVNGEDSSGIDLAGFVDQRLAADSDNLYQESLHMLERYLLTRVLRETQGNQSKAARRLGITRGSLRNKMRDLGIQVGQVVEPAE
jgi:two-component system nitrogen regulation response regulator GlnG